MAFKFELHQVVQIVAGSEIGEVVGRADYVNCVPRYLLRYKAADGRAAEVWWSEDALCAISGL